MIVVLQRVSRAAVVVDGEVLGAIDRGLVLLACAVPDDGPDDAARLAAKLARLRVFEDADGRTNLSLLDVGGGALVVPQFTLAAEWRKGLRPSFDGAAAPGPARRLCAELVAALGAEGVERVEQGRFGATMSVELVNEGPFTLVLDSRPPPT